MIRKTVKEFKRIVPSYDNHVLTDKHAERVRVETWWLLFVPIYSREWIVASNI